MGFRFLKKKALAVVTNNKHHNNNQNNERLPSDEQRDQGQSPSRGRGRSQSAGRGGIISSQNGNSKRPSSARSKKKGWSVFPVTPANHLTTSRNTPTTAPETVLAKDTAAVATAHDHEAEDITDGFELQYRDTVPYSILEEQERIRQQLFYEEEGVEVTAQFRRRSSSRPHSVTPSPTTTRTPSRSPRRPDEQPQSATTKGNDETTQQQKATRTPARSSSTITTTTSSSKKKKRKPKRASSSPCLPVTPTLTGDESDPAAKFPAIAAAQAKAKAESDAKFIQRQASLASASASAAAASHQSSSASTKKISSTTATKSKEKLKKKKQKAAKQQQQQPQQKTPAPFDEDPTIMEIENALSKDATEYTMDEEDDEEEEDDDDDVVEDEEVDLFDAELIKGCGVTTTPNGTTVVSCNPAVAGVNGLCHAAPTSDEVSRQLLEAFNCGDDFTEFSGSAMMHKARSCRLVDSFYDSTCGNYREAAEMKRPYYDEPFAQRFLKDITEEGLNVLWHLPPPDEEASLDSANWSGRSVVMTIQPGSRCSAAKTKDDVSPKLVWTTLGGGKDGQDESKVARCLIPLLMIQSVSTFRDAPVPGGLGDEIDEEEKTGAARGINMVPVDEDDVCLFAITTLEGDVQVFEAASPRERDVFVTGLRNIIARLTFHLVVGDAGASSELYYVEDKETPDGEVPSIPSSPVQNMNRIAHALLD